MKGTCVEVRYYSALMSSNVLSIEKVSTGLLCMGTVLCIADVSRSCRSMLKQKCHDLCPPFVGHNPKIVRGKNAGMYGSFILRCFEM